MPITQPGFNFASLIRSMDLCLRAELNKDGKIKSEGNGMFIIKCYILAKLRIKQAVTLIRNFLTR